MAVVPDGAFIGAVFSHDGGALRSSPLRSTAPHLLPLIRRRRPVLRWRVWLPPAAESGNCGTGAKGRRVVLMMLMEWMH